MSTPSGLTLPFRVADVGVTAVASPTPTTGAAIDGVTRPIWSRLCSVNHRLPSGPAVMSRGSLSRLTPVLTIAIAPAGVIRPIESSALSVNPRLPSGPAVIPNGDMFAGSVNVPVSAPAVLKRRIGPWYWVTQRLPSAPAAIPMWSP